MTAIELPRVVWEFVAATNACDRAWLATLFAEDCRVDACGFRAAGRPAVDSWTDAELFGPGLRVNVLEVHLVRKATVVHAEAVDGGVIHECDLEFHTTGRYIDSLTISR